MSANGIAAPEKVAFLGLGLMGGYMAANLAKAGYTVSAWNRTAGRPGCKFAEEGGAKMVESVKEAVSDAKAVFVCVGDIPDVEEVVLGENGVCTFAPKGIVIVDTSTIGRPAAVSIGKKAAEKGFRFSDAPVSGGDIGAKAGTLTFMIGAEKNDFEEVLPCFNAMGKNIIHCGGIGDGQAVKMCNQVLCGVNMVGVCEALILAEKQGLDPNLITKVCSGGAAGSWALANLGPRIIQDDHDPGFMIKHMLKDLKLVHTTAEELNQQLPGTVHAQALFQQVADKGGEELGTQAMIRTFKS